MYRLLLLFIASLGLVAGCQRAYVNAETRPNFTLEPGSRLTLHQSLEVPRGWARVHVQAGQVIAQHEVNKFLPNCNFEVRDVTPASGPLQRIEPDHFAVGKIKRYFVDSGGIQVAGLSIAGGANDSSSNQNKTTEIQLASEKQPNVMRLRCAHWTDQWYRHLTLAEIRGALGKIATIAAGP
jgi:hypothetical protein